MKVRICNALIKRVDTHNIFRFVAHSRVGTLLGVLACMLIFVLLIIFAHMFVLRSVLRFSWQPRNGHLDVACGFVSYMHAWFIRMIANN